MIRSYSELITLRTFKDRFMYLSLDGLVGAHTFGYDRFINQDFYKSSIWREVRDHVIIRDNGCDLGIAGYDIPTRVIIHHMNALSVDDLRNRNDDLINPEFLICTTHDTHNAIHYGDESLLLSLPNERSKNDTIPWRR